MLRRLITDSIRNDPNWNNETTRTYDRHASQASSTARDRGKHWLQKLAPPVSCRQGARRSSEWPSRQVPAILSINGIFRRLTFSGLGASGTVLAINSADDNAFRLRPGSWSANSTHQNASCDDPQAMTHAVILPRFANSGNSKRKIYPDSTKMVRRDAG
jgi:hypothetical protein